MLIGAAWTVMLPAGVLQGVWLSKLVSIKIKLFGGAAQVSAVLAPGVVLTLVMFRLNRVPEPASGVKSFEKADMRSVLVVPGPLLRTLPVTFQLLAVSPPLEIGVV